MRQIQMLLATALLCAGFSPLLSAAPDTKAESSAGVKEDLSVLAGKMLDKTDQARTAIKDRNQNAALQDVQDAQNDLNQIREGSHGATMIPLYQEFVDISVLRPVISEHEKRNAAKQPEVVHEVSGDYTDVSVSTVEARRNLAAAKLALEQHNWRLADAALADVQQGVSIEAVEAAMPLAKARENLILARSAAEKGNYREVRAALRATSNALESYINAGRPHSVEAKSLKEQIDTYDKNVEQSHTGTVAKINDWWNTTSNWTPYKSQELAKSR
jgi:hypothetical protein